MFLIVYTSTFKIRKQIFTCPNVKNIMENKFNLHMISIIIFLQIENNIILYEHIFQLLHKYSLFSNSICYSLQII
jgi:hypothetical protein